MMNRFLVILFLLPFIVSGQEVLKLKPLDFFKLPEGKNFGEAAGVAVNKQGHVFVFNRGPNSLMEFDEKGKYLRSIGDGFIKKAHGLRIDDNNNIWVTDVDRHIVIGFNPKGKITMILGQADISGEWNPTYKIALFNKPADIGFDSDGNIYVADGYGNSRIVKFDEDGNFLKTWGTKGAGKGEFNLPHNIVIDSKNTLYVVDRDNNRIQLFDTNGAYLSEWTNIGSPFGMAIMNDQFYITDGRNGAVAKLNRDGKILARYGIPGKAIGKFLVPHAITVSLQNKLFVGEVLNWRVQSFEILE